MGEGPLELETTCVDAEVRGAPRRGALTGALRTCETCVIEGGKEENMTTNRADFVTSLISFESSLIWAVGVL